MGPGAHLLTTTNSLTLNPSELAWCYGVGNLSCHRSPRKVSCPGPFPLSKVFSDTCCKLFSRQYCVPSRVLLTEDRTQLVERTLEENEGGREQLLALAEVKPHVDKVTILKRDKGMAGIHDLIDWTLAQV